MLWPAMAAQFLLIRVPSCSAWSVSRAISICPYVVRDWVYSVYFKTAMFSGYNSRSYYDNVFLCSNHARGMPETYWPVRVLTSSALRKLQMPLRTLTLYE